MQIQSSRDILNTLKENSILLKKYKVKKIGLFGSYSFDKANQESDIDFIVDFEEKNFDNFINLVFELEKVFGKKIDLLTEKSISKHILPLIEKEIKWYEA